MTDYTAITEAETNPGAPAKSSLWKRWAKNWIAGFEGALGAPRLRLTALENPAAGTVERSAIAAVQSSTITSISGSTAVHTFGFGQSGTVRMMAEHRSPNAGGVVSTLRFRRWRAGSYTTLQDWTMTSATWAARSLDVDILPGDTLEIYHWTSSGANPSEVRNAGFFTNGEYLWPFASLVRLS